MTTYAKADRKTQWFSDNFSSATFKPNCGVLHTTETTGWPTYDGGAKAPNYTGKPNFVLQRLDYRAHFEDEESSRALVNLSGGVETNTASAIQIELIGTCDPKYATSWGTKKANVDYIYWPNAPQWALKSLAEFIADMNKRHGIKIVGPALWEAYPESYGPGGQRFTFTQWRNFYGWCGHQHVPENNHGDPGKFPWAQVATYAKAIIAGAGTPTPVPAPTTNGTDVTISDADATKIAEKVWNIGIENHDADPLDNVEPGTSKAQAYPVMANFRAADLQGRVGVLETKIDEILTLLKSKPTT